MTTEAPGTQGYEDDPFDEDGERDDCMTCGGEGWEWCDDTNTAEGCWQPDCDGEAHTCPNCRGSGLRKDQWFW